MRQAPSIASFEAKEKRSRHRFSTPGLGAVFEALPGVVTLDGSGPQPTLLTSLEEHLPARDLTRRRDKYFIGVLDPCASIEFTRGCPWDCAFCSAWTFYGRSYRQMAPEAAAEDLARIREPNVFIVDDVGFPSRGGHGHRPGHRAQRSRSGAYLGTRCDVLLRNREVFAYWKRLGLAYMFLGVEALDAEGLQLYRKRATPHGNFEALEVARALGITVAVNIIADPSWDEERFRIVREWAMSVLKIVHLTVNTPYPGTETWFTESRKLTTLDYRLFNVQHAVLPTNLPSSASTKSSSSSRRCCRTENISAWLPCARRAGWRSACWRKGRRISCACCGSSTGSTTPSANMPITCARSPMLYNPQRLGCPSRPVHSCTYMHPRRARGTPSILRPSQARDRREPLQRITVVLSARGMHALPQVRWPP